MNGSNQFTSLDEYKEYLDIVAESNKKQVMLVGYILPQIFVGFTDIYSDTQG